MTAPVVVPRSCSVIPLQPSTMSRSAAATAPNEYLSMVFMRPSMLFVGVLGERGARLRGQSRWHADLLQQVGELVGAPFPDRRCIRELPRPPRDAGGRACAGLERRSGRLPGPWIPR